MYNREDFIQWANYEYGEYEKLKITRDNVINSIEGRIIGARNSLQILTDLRNDVSTRLGRGDELFDRDKHTHHFTNLELTK